MQISSVKILDNQIKFGAGNFTLYSDFDGTYMPFEHEDICVYNCYENSIDARNKFNHCFEPFQDFINKFNDKFKFIVTTGRNRSEFEYFIEKITSQGGDIAKPDILITCDGSDMFYKTNNTYPITSIDKQKRLEIRNELNWDNEKILSQIKEVIQHTNTKDGKKLHIIDVPINKNYTDYGEISLEYILQSDEQLKQSFASFNEGYDFHPYIVFSDNADGKAIKTNLEELFRKLNINVEIFYCENDWDIEKNRTYQSISIKPLGEKGFWKNKKINKLIDTHKQVEDEYRTKSDNLVIIAGDAGNDEDMLNIFNYVDITGIEIPKFGEYERFMQNYRNREKLKELPIISIVVGNKKSLDLIRRNDILLRKYGICKTIFIDYELGETLIEGVKKSVYLYSKENKKFKDSLGTDLLNEISSNDNELLQRKYEMFMRETKNLFSKFENLKWGYND